MFYTLMCFFPFRMVLYCLTVLLWTAFFVSVHRESRRFLNVLLLASSLSATWAAVSLLLSMEIGYDLSHYLYFPLFLAALASAGGFIVDGVIAVRREGMSKFTLLPVMAGIGILLLIGAYSFLMARDIAGRDEDVWLCLGISLFRVIVYVPIMAMAFALYSFLYQRVINHLVKSPRWLVVLGCKVTKKGCPPLLRSRLDKAAEVYAKTGAKMIVSGGQGKDEPCSEAEAMKRYLTEKGIPEEKITAEDQSRSTWENMKFSGKIMKADVGETKGFFVTNNYHVLRSALLARNAGLALHGIGSRTAGYFRPPATLREVAAVIIAYKKVFYVYLTANLLYTVVSVLFFA